MLPTTSKVKSAWALSGHPDEASAASHVIEHMRAEDAVEPAALVVMASHYESPGLGLIVRELQASLRPHAMVAMACPGVIGGRSTFERRPGIAALALWGEGVRASAFSALPDRMHATLEAGHPPALRDLACAGDDARCTLLFADASSTPVAAFVAGLGAALGRTPLIGSLAGDAQFKVDEALAVGGMSRSGGIVGLTLSGDLSVDVVVAQGCRPVGPTMLVTRAKNNVVLEIGGRKAIEALRDVAQRFSADDRPLLAGGLYLGLAVDEYRGRFGRGDFIVSRIVGGDEGSGSVVLDHPVSVGRTVQVHLRDPELAKADLDLLMDAQKLHARPAGALVLTDWPRGQTMFGDAWSDAMGVARAFEQVPAGEVVAKAGYPIPDSGGPVPLAGALSQGPIAPIAGTTRQQALTACVAVFRDRAEPG